ncbi:nuclease [Candidatus Nitrosoglobus terrae]|uniref:Nuclease n=1 Tax=Candidatus Nitrosoglobus terrae TaxID=1630141 RepID=A0A1Q2SLI8_9GAMM|nr:thermonuclease family protein [Candidatus Nitrosoglobus terrae]BAW79969.1 nuclease [Candidatus Nitrosoglobus terrae]
MKTAISNLAIKGLIGLVLLGLPLAGISLESAIFRWIDSEGTPHYSDRPHPNAQVIQLKPEVTYYDIQRVYDGDTIRLKGGDRVRLLGINAPEIEGRYKSAEPGGEAARDWLRKELEGKRVRLEFDKERSDHYSRLLAHIFTANGEHLNLRLVEEGLAIVSFIPPNFKYSDQLAQAQTQAEVAKRGLWSLPHYAPRSIIDLEKGANHQGWQRYRGTPIEIRAGRKYTRLLFSPHVDVRIAKDQLPFFGKLERYLGNQVEVRGWVFRRQNDYSIPVYHPSGLKQLPIKIGFGHRPILQLYVLQRGVES